MSRGPLGSPGVFRDCDSWGLLHRGTPPRGRNATSRPLMHHASPQVQNATSRPLMHHASPGPECDFQARGTSCTTRSGMRFSVLPRSLEQGRESSRECPGKPGIGPTFPGSAPSACWGAAARCASRAPRCPSRSSTHARRLRPPPASDFQHRSRAPASNRRHADGLDDRRARRAGDVPTLAGVDGHNPRRCPSSSTTSKTHARSSATLSPTPAADTPSAVVPPQRADASGHTMVTMACATASHVGAVKAWSVVSTCSFCR